MPSDETEPQQPDARAPDPDEADASDPAPESGDDSLAPGTALLGPAAIRASWKHAPKGPGVYRMIGADEEVLYVGKAKSVRQRIASYTRAQGHTNRIARMIALTRKMVFVSTATETEALLLETNLIKQLKPRFNVLMRDDKSFPYILITGDHPAAQITKHRGARSRKGEYFGPFASVWAVNRTLNALERAFLLRSCTDSYYENRTRPCLLHQIKRCSGPCTGEISLEDYAGLVGEARAFLKGRSRTVREMLAREMETASEALEFERAARLRDRIAALSAIQGVQGINPKTTEEADVFAIIEEAGRFCVEVFFFRTFQNWGNRSYFPKADASLTPGEVLEAFLAQFYSERPPPRLVLLPVELEGRALLETALTERYGAKVECAVPQRGEKRELIDYATQNAKASLGRTLSETASQEKLLAALAEAFGLERTLRRVEVYDNSHIMGTNAVGGMIVAGAGGFMKTHYRTFNIKDATLTPGDDFGMMREVLRRRFTRLNKEAPAAADPPSPLRGGDGGGGPGRELDDDEAGAIEQAPTTPIPDPSPQGGRGGSGGSSTYAGIVRPAETMREWNSTPPRLVQRASSSAQRGRGTARSAVESADAPSPLWGGVRGGGSPRPLDEAEADAFEQAEATPIPDPSPQRGREPEATEEDDTFPARPDLILIDGGQGQFSATREILAELGVTDVAVAAIAKGRDRDAGRETFLLEGREPFRLAPRDPALYFVQRLRDEAHRFAIGTHRARRKKEFTKNPLDEISGIGPARKRALLAAFGTAKALSRAALADLEKVPGISAGTAKLVYDFFHDGGR